MNKEQKKFKKVKERERKAKKKVLSKRTTLRKAEKERKRIAATLDNEAKLFDKKTPILRPEKQKLKDERDAAKKDKIMQQLEHNLEILEALEDEYLKEELARDEVNEELEAQGLKTVKEKIDYLKKKAQADAEAMEKKLIDQQNSKK